MLRASSALMVALAILFCFAGPAPAAKLEREYPLWQLTLDEPDVQILLKAHDAASGLTEDPKIQAAIFASRLYVDKVDEHGGRNGVDVVGCEGATGCIVTPKGSTNALGKVKDGKGKAAEMLVDWVANAKKEGGKLKDEVKVLFGKKQENGGSMVGLYASGVNTNDGNGSFLVVSLDKNRVMLRSTTGLVMAFPPPPIHDGWHLRADSQNSGEWEVFTMDYVAKDLVVLKNFHGRYVTMEDYVVGCKTTEVDKAARLKIVQDKDGTHFQCPNGRFLIIR